MTRSRPAWPSALLALLVMACSGGGTRVETPLPATPSSLTAPIEPSPSPPQRSIRGLFAEPQPSQPQFQRSVPPQPAASFEKWNRVDVVLYDIEARTASRLGPGAFPVFAANGTYLAWNSEVTGVMALDLEDGVVRALGPSGFPHVVDGGRLWVQSAAGDYEVEIATGARRQLPGITVERFLTSPQQSDRWTLTRVYPGDRQEPTFELIDRSGVLGPLRIEARSAALAPDGRLFVVTQPGQLERQGGVIPGLVGWSNVFEVDPETLTATFIASVRASEALFPFAAGEHYVAWTEDFCNIANLESLAGVSSFPDSNGRTRIYDRQLGLVTELDHGFYIAGVTPRGELAIGAFGADALLDIETLEYTVVFPSEDRVWSPDYRYAAVGTPGGHGGYCGGE